MRSTPTTARRIIMLKKSLIAVAVASVLSALGTLILKRVQRG